MSRHPSLFRATPSLLHAMVPAFLAAALLLPAASSAGVIQVDVDTYRLDGAPGTTSAWEIAEKLAAGKDVAIVVMDKKATKATVQTLLHLLETLNIPTLFTKKADYKALVDRGVLRPVAAP